MTTTEDKLTQQVLDLVAGLHEKGIWPRNACCPDHNRHCEIPSELCCPSCTETAHNFFPPKPHTCVLEKSPFMVDPAWVCSKHGLAHWTLKPSYNEGSKLTDGRLIVQQLDTCELCFRRGYDWR